MGGVVLPAALAGTACGILAADLLGPGGLPVVALAAGILLGIAGALLRRPAPLALGILLVAAAAGAWRGTAAALPTGPGSVSAAIGTELPLTGVVIEEPRPRGERQQVVLGELLAGDPPLPLAGRVLAWLPRGVAVEAGDRVSFDARLAEPRDFEGFAYREYLARQGIGATTSAYRLDVAPGASRGWIATLLGDVRATLLRGLNAVVPEPEAALGAGILLGVRASIAPDVAEAFATAGLTHVVAISGWNIAIVAALAGAATRPLLGFRGGRGAALALAALAVAAYVLVTGASPSVVRAGLMAGGLVLARLGGSRAHAASALMLAALVMLMAAPPVLWDVGFQLSGLATAGLIWFGAAIEARLARWPAFLREPVALSLAAQLTTLPIILLNFERLSLVAPMANVVVVPLVPIVMLCSALAALIGAADGALHLPLLGDVLVWASGGSAWLYLRLMILAGQVAASVPLASVPVGAPAWLAAAWYPMLLMVHRRIPAAPTVAMPAAALPVRAWAAVAATLAILVVLTLLSRPDGMLHLVVLDIGQGDAILVRTPTGATMLVDGGPDPDLAARRLGEWLPFWQRSIDVVVMTHPHEDHVAGLVPALERYRVGLVVEPGRAYGNPSYERFRALAGDRLVAGRAGMRVDLDAATAFEILFPTDADAAAPLPDGDINDASIVGVLTDGSFSALLTGDAEAPVEALLLSRGALRPVDVLKVGHHGSDSSSTPPFLAALRPAIALISDGAGNEYGHPHAVTLQHLAEVGARVLRTDQDGSIELVFDGTRLRTQPHPGPDAGSIGPWPSLTVSRRRRSSTPSSCPTASCGTRRASSAWQPRPRGWSRPPACRSTWSWSRPPPCCTTWTRWRRAAATDTASWPPAG